MATPPTDPLAAQTVPSATTKTTPTTTEVTAEPEMVTVQVLTDTPVDRVMKGDTLSLAPEIADQFSKLKLVEIVKD
jgi:hypothetical protein